MNRKVDDILKSALAGESLDDRVTAQIADNVFPRPDGPIEVMVGRSLKLPVQTYERIKEIANDRGVGMSTLIREWIDAGIADIDSDKLVSLADVHRLLAKVPDRSHQRAA